jgi:hypothetical protein
MIVSRNEIETLVLKACRGAGMSWGLAEEAARAAPWLADRALPWDRSLLARLEQGRSIAAPVLAGGDIRPGLDGEALCPIHAGAALSDLLGQAGILTLHHVVEPIWLLPFADRRARPGGRVVLWWEGGGVELAAAQPIPGHGALRGLLVDRVQRILVELHPGAGGEAPIGRTERLRRPEPPQGIVADPAAWAALETWAARTYVPASRHSRLAGAGAGLSDND